MDHNNNTSVFSNLVWSQLQGHTLACYIVGTNATMLVPVELQGEVA